MLKNTNPLLLEGTRGHGIKTPELIGMFSVSKNAKENWIYSRKKQKQNMLNTQSDSIRDAIKHSFLKGLCHELSAHL